METSLGSLQHLSIGECEVRLVNEKSILIVHLTDGFFATSAKCTHLFKSLKKGKIIADKCIQCPLHKAEFDIRSGEVIKWANKPAGVQLLNILRPKKALATYPVVKKQGGYYLQLDDLES